MMLSIQGQMLYDLKNHQDCNVGGLINGFLQQGEIVFDLFLSKSTLKLFAKFYIYIYCLTI